MADAYAALSAVVLVDRDLDAVLQEISEIARAALPGSDATSITLVRGDRAWTAAHTGELAQRADELQYETGHGPCLDAGRTGMLLVADDLLKDDRWPQYSPRVVSEVGVRSSMSVPLPFQGATVGGLNNYSVRPRTFDDRAVRFAQEICVHVAIAVMNADAHAEATNEVHHLRQALESRKVIDMALGILMSAHHCSPEVAFTILSRAPQNRNQKLRELAATIVRSTMNPDGPRQTPT